MSTKPLNIKEFPEAPESKVRQWLDEARKAGVVLPTAASLATAELPSGQISNRMVNTKGVNENGNVEIYSDFTNSRKGKDLSTNKNVALTFFWQEQNRSIRLEGKLKFLSTSESEAFFKSRPKGFQASVLMGDQSQPANSREELVHKLEQLMTLPESQFKIPNYWFGTELIPEWVEFYQESDDGITDRITYTLCNGKWNLRRINP